MGKECSREGSKGQPLPHTFVISTEKQHSRDLPSLPNLEPGEGKQGLGVQGWDDPKKPLGWSKKATECVYGGAEVHRL